MTDKPRMRTTRDGLTNVMTGLGTSKSKSSNNTWVMGYNATLDYHQLEAAYTDNWIAAAIVDMRAEDMTRNWRRIKSDGAEDIAAYEDKIQMRHSVFEAVKWSRLYGGAGILMITDQDLTKPLNVNRLKKDSLKKLIVFDRWDLNGTNYNWSDMESSNYEKPSNYTLGRMASVQVHHSHIVRFEGIPLPRRLRALNNSWGDSELRRCIDDVGEMVAAKTGIADLLQEANVDVINRVGLTEELASDEDDAIVDRYALFARMKSVVNLALLDGDEVYSRNTLNLTGVSQVLEQMMTYISGSAKTPVTKLFGTSAKGMSATGEGDMNNYYDSISASQTSYLENPLRQLDEVLVRSALGAWPTSYDYVWNPLGTPNSVEVAQANLLNAQTNDININNNTATRLQVMRSYQADELYQYDDDKLEELEGLEDSNLLDDLPEVGEGDLNVGTPDPNSALNGAQVTSLVTLANQVANRGLTLEQGVAIIQQAFPIGEKEARDILGNGVANVNAPEGDDNASDTP